MKAITQIIHYLRGHGFLSQEELVELATLGFLRWDEVYDLSEDESADAKSANRDDLSREDEELYAPTYRTKPELDRKGRHIQHKGVVLDAPEIAQRLHVRFDTWQPALDGLLRLGRQLGTCGDWEEATVAIRNAGPGLLYRALVKGLTHGDPSLHALWNSLSLESYHDILGEPGLHGPAVSAYRAVLALNDHAHLGHHGWLLKEKEVAQVFNLRQAQRCLLQACGQLLTREPELIATVLRRDYHWLAYWAFVLLYTARRGQVGQRPLSTNEEHHPPRAQPTEAGWLQAWAHAVVMDPQAVTPFLFEYNALQERRPNVLQSTLRDQVNALVPFPFQVYFSYYAEGRTPEAMAARIGKPEPDILQELERLRQNLHKALEMEPVLQWPLHAEPARIREALIDDGWRFCTRGDPYLCKEPPSPELHELANRYFGPVADLLCPRKWD